MENFRWYLQAVLDTQGSDNEYDFMWNLPCSIRTVLSDPLL